MRTAHLPWPQHQPRSRRFSRSDLVRILTVLLPPLAVKMIGAPRAIPLNILLTACGWIPGVIHARRLFERANQHNFSADQLVSALAHHVRR